MPGPFFASLVLHCPSCGAETYRSEVDGTPEVVERWRAAHESLARRQGMRQDCACGTALELVHDGGYGSDVTDADGKPAKDRDGKPARIKHGVRLVRAQM